MKRIAKDKFVLSMSPAHPPALKAESGSTVVFETCDCFSNKIDSEDQLFSSVGWDSINPATGPLYIEGAAPGDILKVEVLEIQTADSGVMTTAPGFGILGDRFDKEVTKIIPILNGRAIFNDKIHIPVNPMIGVLGVAPETGEILTGTPGEHGANMDCKRLVKGAVIYLRINVPGALLCLGDLHAVQADGEIVICGVEISGEVTVKTTVIKGKRLPLPMLVEGDHLMTLASAETLDDAAKTATRNMHTFMTDELKMDAHEAGMLLSVAGDLRICQVVDPLMTARMELPLWVLEKHDYRMI
jgi:amidase